MNSLRGYLNAVSALVNEIPEEDLGELIELFWGAYQRRARLVFCGNGGSAATASHLVADFQKNIYLAGGRPWEVLALTDSTPLITAWSNDTEYANVFAGQARCWVRPGDLLVAISGSGNSPNVVAAVEAANEIGAMTVALAGYGGGKLSKIARHSFVLLSRNMQLVEDAHMIIGHAIYCEIRDRLVQEAVLQAAADQVGS
jgi:D-sedoheptulose 7-phosphate isomerase